MRLTGVSGSLFECLAEDEGIVGDVVYQFGCKDNVRCAGRLGCRVGKEKLGDGGWW